MLIVDPVTLGDVACTRASTKWVTDRNGTLVQVPANTLAVTYDPSDLSKAPYALVEPAATNMLVSSVDLSNAGVWSYGSNGGLAAGAAVAPDGTLMAAAYTHGISTGNFAYLCQGSPSAADASQPHTYSVWVKVPTGTAALALAISNLSIGTANGPQQTVTAQWQRLSFTLPAGALANTGSIGAGVFGTPGQVYHVWGEQLEIGNRATSYIPTIGSPVTRAADIIAPGAGVVFSNVPIIEAPYNASTTYAKDALVYDPVSYNAFQSLADANAGKALTNTSFWTPRGAINRRAMLDQYNNTQTSNPEEIILVVSPQAISRGIYIGNVDASEVRWSVVDQYKGLVYQEVQSLRVSTSGSSFYNWCFNRIKRRTWALSLKLPPYANALVTLCLRKPGGTAKCGMFAIGPIVDLGKTLMGLGAEIKDFSETSFNFDGTSKTQLRNYAKRITADVSVDSDQVDAVYEALADYRQRPIVWVGSQNYGLSIAFGRYSSFKPVIKGVTRWEMSLQIEGTV